MSADADARYRLEDLADLSGLSVAELRDFWRALGFPDPRPGEQLFTAEDLEMLSTVVALIADGSIEPDIARQFARVIGSSLERIAATQVDVWLRDAGPADSVGEAEIATMAAEAAAVVPDVLALVWRRRLVEEARRRLVRAQGPDDEVVSVIGFADLVGFTARTRSLSTESLAEVVGRFESIAYDVVGSFAGRVVKTIGDEVLFVNDDPTAGCRSALELARRYREDDELSDVRVGLDFGPVLEREGDVYGPVVNTASRIARQAQPGSVVVSGALHDAVGAVGGFDFMALGVHELKGIGPRPLWRIGLVGDTAEEI